MNIYKYTFPILLALISSVTNAQSISDKELAKQISQKFQISSFYIKQGSNLINLDEPYNTDFNAVIQNFCKSNKALYEIKMIAKQHPQVPRDILNKADTNYQDGIKAINQLKQMSPNKIECNE